MRLRTGDTDATGIGHRRHGFDRRAAGQRQPDPSRLPLPVSVQTNRPRPTASASPLVDEFVHEPLHAFGRILNFGSEAFPQERSRVQLPRAFLHKLALIVA